MSGARRNRLGLNSRARKALVIALVLTVVVAGISSWFLEYSPPAAGSAEVIKVGFTLSFSGSASYEAADELRGITLWKDSVNTSGGVYVKALGQRAHVELVYYDDQSRPDLATSLYEKLVNEDKTDILLGTSVSLTTSPAAAVAAKHDMFFLAPQAADPMIYRQNYTSVLGTMPLVDQFAGPVWPFLAQAGVRKVAILYDKSIDLWVSAHANDITEAARNNLDLVLDEGYIKDTENFVPLLFQAQSVGAEALIVEDYMVPNVINIVQQMRSSGTHFQLFFNVYVGTSFKQFDSSLGDLGVYCFGSTLWLPSLNYAVNYGYDSATFLSEMRKQYGTEYTPGAFAVTEYVSGLIVQRTLETAVSLKTKDLVTAALALSGDFKTLAGATLFEKTERGIEQRGNSFVLVQVAPETSTSRRLEIVYPSNVKTAEPVIAPQEGKMQTKELGFSFFVSLLLVGLILAGYYAAEALGLNLIYGVLRRINFAHGDFAMVGAFSLFWLWSIFGLNLAVSALLVIPLLFAIGLGVFLLLDKPISHSDDPEMTSLIVFYGISLFLSSTAILVWSADIRSIPTTLAGASISILGSAVPLTWALGGGVGFVCVALTFLFLYRTKMGRQIRAVMQNKEEAELVGINSFRVKMLAFGLGFAFIGIFASVQPLVFPSIYPKMGLMITITAFIITIIGGLGKPLGTVVGALIYSVTYTIIVTLLSPAVALLAVFIVMLVILYVSKGGIVK